MNHLSSQYLGQMLPNKRILTFASGYHNRIYVFGLHTGFLKEIFQIPVVTVKDWQEDLLKSLNWIVLINFKIPVFVYYIRFGMGTQFFPDLGFTLSAGLLLLCQTVCSGMFPNPHGASCQLAGVW